MNETKVILASGATAARRFGSFVTGVSLMATMAGCALFFLDDPEGSLLRGEIFAVLFSVALGYGYAVYSYARFGAVSYELDGEIFRARRGDRVVFETPLERLDAFRMRHVMDRRSFLIQVYPPSWPRGVVTYRDSHGRRTIDLPPVLLWGREELAAAEASLQRTLLPEQ